MSSSGYRKGMDWRSTNNFQTPTSLSIAKLRKLKQYLSVMYFAALFPSIRDRIPRGLMGYGVLLKRHAINIDQRLAVRRSERIRRANATPGMGPQNPQYASSAILQTQPELPRTLPAAGRQPTKHSSRNPTTPSLGNQPAPATAPGNQRRGTLTQQEKDGRRRLGVRMYCGQPGHFAVECPNNGLRALNPYSPNPDT